MKKLKVMCIYAHPADPITDCGGTLALHHENGDEVYSLVLTHGGRKHPNYFVKEWRKENPDPAIINMTRDDIIEFKKNELKRAAKIIGIDKLYFLDHDDDNLMMTDEIIEQTAAVISEVCPEILILDYPYANCDDVHSLTTRIAFKALERVAAMLQNMDGDRVGNKESFQYYPKQIYFTKIPVTVSDVFTMHGFRNDVYIDITPVVEKKIRAMDQFITQSYHDDVSRKFVESHDGAYGRAAGVAFAEGYLRKENETHSLLPVTTHALGEDFIMAHEDYSHLNVRSEFPYIPNYVSLED